MAGNTGTTIQSNQTFTTGVVPLVQGVLNPANSPQTVWDCGIGCMYAMMTTVVTGTPTSFTIVLEGTYDGNTWTTLATTTNTAGETVTTTGAIPFTNLRARCSAVSGGSSPTVNVFATAASEPMALLSSPTAAVGQGLKVSPGSISPATAQSAATTGNGTTIDFGAAVGTVMWQIVPAGTITAGAVSMEISLDGVTFFAPPTATMANYSAATLANPYTLVTATNALFDVGTGNIAARYARARISSNVTGAGGNVTVQISGY